MDAEIRRAIEIEAEATEDTAVYNLDLIRKLKKRVGRLENDNVAQAKHIELLTRLMERIGRAVDALADWHDKENLELICDDVAPVLNDGYFYTPAGQREYDAAMHEAEGAPPTRESEGAWGYE